MEVFENDQVSVDSLPNVEKVILLPLSRKYWRIILFNTVLVLVLMAAGFSFFLVKKEVELRFWLIGGSVWLGILLFQLTIRYYAFLRRGYAVRQRDVIYQHGLLAMSTTVVPFCRIQHVAVKEGLFSRMLGLVQLQLFTAGGAASDLKISGIPKDEAERIRTYMMQQLVENEQSIDPSISAQSSTSSEIPLNGDQQ
jgi:membrane protein YdbS with pleckstrin-like domain